MPLSRSLEKFRRSLEGADGASEFVVAVVCDVRGFSDFSTRHESPDLAMYIKRLYVQLITRHFPTAKFVKPTGDGLLLVFPYNEGNLPEVAKSVVDGCFECHKHFATICDGDPMINFETPERVGFGISRGTACRLFSGNDILDYSGHILNLASRLMDLARPSGIVIDGGFMSEIIPQSHRSHFDEARVYVRSIAEEQPRLVFFAKEFVRLAESSLLPIKSANWRVEKRTVTRAILNQMAGNYAIDLPARPADKSSVRVEAVYPNPKLKGFATRSPVHDINVEQDRNIPRVMFSVSKLSELLKGKKLKLAEPVVLEIHYIAC
jgi:class 3 adenylate cyclase